MEKKALIFRPTMNISEAYTGVSIFICGGDYLR
jgi:hypothetical protein